jgi:F-type H+-transporting ATPase subunit gamma
VTDTLVGLRRKIASAGELRSVVRTMKALAAASIGQYQASVRALSDYLRAVELGLGACFRESESLTAPTEPRPRERPIAAVVFGSDQGLVGQFNEAVATHALSALGTMPSPARVWAVGERVSTRLADAAMPITGLFAVPTSVEGIRPLVARILVATEAHGVRGDFGELHLFYNRPVAEAGHAPFSLRLLPLDETWRRETIAQRWPTTNLPEIVGDGTETLRALIREHLFISIFRACAESLASENGSRLSAMERAEKNIEDLLESLHGEFHQMRQSSIDEELFDVVAGFEAFSGTNARRRD